MNKISECWLSYIGLNGYLYLIKRGWTLSRFKYKVLSEKLEYDVELKILGSMKNKQAYWMPFIEFEII